MVRCASRNITHICLRKALSGVSTYSIVDGDARDTADAREFVVALDLWEAEDDVFVDRVEFRAGIMDISNVSPEIRRHCPINP